MTYPLRLGRIGYANVLPVYHPLDTGEVPCTARIVSGVPAKLNAMLAAGELDVSACSSIEYARRPDEYLLVPDLAIGAPRHVQSVLLVSRLPVARLDGQRVLVSSQTHTSAALLRLFLSQRIGVSPEYAGGDVAAALAGNDPPAAALAIGDEALKLRNQGEYPHLWDLGSIWQDWTGLPFIFGVWVVRREAYEARPDEVAALCRALLEAKARGLASLEAIAALAAARHGLDEAEAVAYFAGLSYDLGQLQRAGLAAFFARLEAAGEIPAAPALDFVSL